MKTQNQSQVVQSVEVKPRALQRGTIIGRAVDKLTALADAEAAELAQSPTAIKERFAAKRQALLDELEPSIKAAVLAAASAMQPAKAAAE